MAAEENGTSRPPETILLSAGGLFGNELLFEQWSQPGGGLSWRSHLRLVSPRTQNRTVTPKRRLNEELRTREYLTNAEIAKLSEVAKANRWGHRDATMILGAYRHGFRASELVNLRWDQIDFTAVILAVRRVKRGSPSTHPLRGDEVRALRKLQREQEPRSPFVFTSERGAPFTTAGFARMVERAGGVVLQGPSAPAASCLWLRPGEYGALYAGAASVPGSPEYSAHGAVHRISARSLQAD